MISLYTSTFYTALLYIAAQLVVPVGVYLYHYATLKYIRYTFGCCFFLHQQSLKNSRWRNLLSYSAVKCITLELISVFGSMHRALGKAKAFSSCTAWWNWNWNSAAIQTPLLVNQSRNLVMVTGVPAAHSPFMSEWWGPDLQVAIHERTASLVQSPHWSHIITAVHLCAANCWIVGNVHQSNTKWGNEFWWMISLPSLPFLLRSSTCLQVTLSE